MHIPIFPVEAIDDAKPDYILILPWNLKDEIVRQMAAMRQMGRQVYRSDPGGRSPLERRDPCFA